MTIRERIQSFQSEIIKGDLLPTRAAEMLTELSALIGNVNEEITKADKDPKVFLKSQRGRIPGWKQFLKRIKQCVPVPVPPKLWAYGPTISGEYLGGEASLCSFKE